MALNFEFNETRFVDLLTKLIGEVKFLQNNPGQGLIPEESRVGDHVLALLGPLSEENGGPLKIERVEFHPKRNNIIIEYPGKTDKTISFVGSHMDVVPANPEEWDKDPFVLTREGDKLYGRGTTDCLGHVALVTELFMQLAEKKPELDTSVIAVLIASEENNSIPGVGVDKLMETGRLERLKNGPLYWVDSADKQPCIGTGSVAAWRITAHGKLGHTGLPQNAINSLILAYEAAAETCRRFHQEFPAHELEESYRYEVPSTMKPTRWSQPPSSVNQVPGQAVIEGDIRLTPFYNIFEAKEKVEGYIKDINENITALPGRGPRFGYELPDGSRGKVEIEWISPPMKGIACDRTSRGFKAISEATKEVLGESKPYSLTGSLPLVGDLKDAGFDVQVCGYGLSKVYHGINEYGEISSFAQGFQIFSKVIERLNA